MTNKTKTVLLRFARVTTATAVASIAGFIAGPDVLSWVPGGYQFLVTGALVPALVAFEKRLRYGSDPGES